MNSVRVKSVRGYIPDMLHKVWVGRGGAVSLYFVGNVKLKDIFLNKH